MARKENGVTGSHDGCFRLYQICGFPWPALVETCMLHASATRIRLLQPPTQRLGAPCGEMHFLAGMRNRSLETAVQNSLGAGP